MIRRKTSIRGGVALALVVLMTFVIAATGSLMLQVSVSQNKVRYESHAYMEMSYAADGAFQRLRRDIETSAYDSVGNMWLLKLQADGRLAPMVPWGDEVEPQEAHARAYPDFSIGRCDVATWVYPRDTESKLYTLVVRLETPAGPLVPRRQKKKAVYAQDVQAHDLFNRFATFVNRGELNFGETIVNGDVHTNGSVHFYFGNARFLAHVSARQGAGFHAGASIHNTYFGETLNPRASNIPMPDRSDLDKLAFFADAEYFVDPEKSPAYSGLGASDLDASIEFFEDKVRITAINAHTHEVVKSQDLPYPPKGVIFVHGNVRSIKGRNSGKVSVATPGRINVTGDLIAVDGQGDPSYVLKKGGSVVDPAAETEAWVESAGYSYEKNAESYNPPAGQEPVLGLLAGEQILLGGDGDNLQVHAALFSLNSNWQADLASGRQRANLRIVGSMVTQDPGVRAEDAVGFGKSGGYIYDESMLNNPPPHWLRVESASFRARRRLY